MGASTRATESPASSWPRLRVSKGDEELVSTTTESGGSRDVSGMGVELIGDVCTRLFREILWARLVK